MSEKAPYEDHPLYDAWKVVKGWTNEDRDLLLETARCTRCRNNAPAVDLYPKDNVDTEKLIDRVETEFDVSYVETPPDRLRFVQE